MELQTLELPNNYFFAMQFHGDFKSHPSRSSPEYCGFVSVCLNTKRQSKARLFLNFRGSGTLDGVMQESVVLFQWLNLPYFEGRYSSFIAGSSSGTLNAMSR